MTYYFVRAAGGVGFFNDRGDETREPPAGSVKITDDVWAQLVKASHDGKKIDVDADGNPLITDESTLSPEDAWRIYQASARIAYDESVQLVMSYVAKNQPVPPAVADYRAQLEAVMAAPSGTAGPLPVAPPAA